MAKAKKSTEVVPANQGAATELVIGNRKVTILKRVTVPLLKQIEGQSVGFTILGRMYKGKPLTPAKGDKEPAREPPTMVPVREITSGREMVYIVPAQLKLQLIEQYDGDPDNAKATHTYVGKAFAVYFGAMGETKTGRRLRQIEAIEIEDNGEVADDVVSPGKKA